MPKFCLSNFWSTPIILYFKGCFCLRLSMCCAAACARSKQLPHPERIQGRCFHFWDTVWSCSWQTAGWHFLCSRWFWLAVTSSFSFSGRIVEQQRRHAEAKRELLASRSFKSPIWGALPAVLGSPQVHPASVEHARLVIQLCLPTARWIFCLCVSLFSNPRVLKLTIQLSRLCAATSGPRYYWSLLPSLKQVARPREHSLHFSLFAASLQNRRCRSRTRHTVCCKEHQPIDNVGNCCVHDSFQQFRLSLIGQRGAPHCHSCQAVSCVLFLIWSQTHSWQWFSWWAASSLWTPHLFCASRWQYSFLQVLHVCP